MLRRPRTRLKPARRHVLPGQALEYPYVTNWFAYVTRSPTLRGVAAKMLAALSAEGNLI